MPTASDSLLMLLDPTDDPGSEMALGSLFTDGGSLLTDGGRSLLTDGGSLFIEEDPMLPPYRGGVGAFECMDTRLESSDITRADGLSR
jgi:hypothetical protein